MANLSLNNIFTVSVSANQIGFGQFNTSNLALFTHDTVGSGPNVSPTLATKGYAIYLSPTQAGIDFGTGSATYAMVNAIFAQQPNILAGGGYLVVIPFTGSGETLAVAITRTQGLVQYFGVMAAQLETQVDMLAAAAVIQALPLIGFFVSSTAADVASSGMLDLLRSGNFNQSRGLYFNDGTAQDTLNFMASYASAAMSVNFNGSNTTKTMHLKTLQAQMPDSTMTQTLLGQCQSAGVDCYPCFGQTLASTPVGKVFTSGTNTFFDDIYNLLWFVTSLQLASVNVLAQTANKIPQTEDGMLNLKQAERLVCKQAVANQFVAPGTWTNPTTFGNQADFLNNIAQVGYYIYSSPIALQSPVARAARQSPLVQIALKYSGAIHSGNIVVNVNP